MDGPTSERLRAHTTSWSRGQPQLELGSVTFDSDDFAQPDLALVGATFVHATFGQGTFPEQATHLEVQSGRATNTYLRKTNLVKASFRNFRFNSCHLNRVSGSHAVFEDVEFAASTFTKGLFANAVFRRVVFTQCSFVRTSFEDAVFIDCELLDPVVISLVRTEGATVTPASRPNTPDILTTFKEADGLGTYPWRLRRTQDAELIAATTRHLFVTATHESVVMVCEAHADTNEARESITAGLHQAIESGSNVVALLQDVVTFEAGPTASAATMMLAALLDD